MTARHLLAALLLTACASPATETESGSTGSAATATTPHYGRPCLPESYSTPFDRVPGYTVAQLHAPCGGDLECVEKFETHMFYCQNPTSLQEGFRCDPPGQESSDPPRSCEAPMTCQPWSETDHLHNVCWKSD